MAIKKTTAVKKSDPTPKKQSGPPKQNKFAPNAFIAGKNFAKLNAEPSYYYEEGVKGRGQGGIRMQKDMPSLDKKRSVSQVQKDAEFGNSLLPEGLRGNLPKRKLVDYEKYVESVRANSNAYKGAKAVAASKAAATLAKKKPLPSMGKKK